MPSKLFDDDDGDFPQNKGPVVLEVDDEYRRKLARRREAEDLKRFDMAVAQGEIVEDEEDESESEESSGNEDESESEESSGSEEEIGVDEVSDWLESLVKLQKHDSEFLATGEIDVAEKKDRKKKDKKKKKKMYLKDVQAQQLLEEGSDAGEEDEGRSNNVRSYGEQQEELRRAVSDAMEAGGEESDDDEDLLKVKEGDDDSEEDEELKEMADEYFGKESELGEGEKFLRDYLLKQMWKEKDGKSKTEVIDEAELKQISDDEEMVILQQEFETKYRHEEKAGEMGIVMGQSRIVEGSVRKKDNPRKQQRMNKEDRNKIAKIEREEELKRLKNVKKNEIQEKMKKVLSIAGFKDGEEFPLDARNLDDEFDPEEYDKMMKAAFDDTYYGAEDSELHCDDDDDDDEKPDFDKEDELLGLPKNWDVIQSGDGFTATREKVLKQKEDGISDDDEEQEDQEEVEEEEEEREGKRKRKRKISLVKRAKEALMEEYYKLDYEDTIGDLKTRFKFAKVQPNSYGLEKEEILFLDDTELNQYVPLKKMAPYMEKDWEVNKYKLKEQKHKFSELLERIDNPDEKRSKKKSKKRDAEDKRDVVKEKKPVAPIADEEGEAETSKLSRKAKRRRREAEKKLPPNRMVAYGKTN